MTAVSMMGPTEYRLKDVRQDTALIMETINGHEPMAKILVELGYKNSYSQHDSPPVRRASRTCRISETATWKQGLAWGLNLSRPNALS